MSQLLSLVPLVPVERFIGIPYVSRGDSFEGCDCWGLVWLFSKLALGHEVPRYAGYSDAEGADIPKRIREGWAGWEPIQRGSEQLGDVLALRVGEHPVHAGIVLRPGRMLHVLKGSMSCQADYDVGMWKIALVRIGRWMS